MNPISIPIIRHGQVYESLDTAPVPAVGADAPTATVSLANAGLIRRDVRRLDGARQALAARSVASLVEACEAAAEPYRSGTIELGGVSQSAEAYTAACSATTGLPHTLVRANLDKVAHVLAHVATVLKGLTRGLDLSVLDRGLGTHDGVPLGFVPAARSLAAVLPSNSPGVHSLWIPALALKTPVVLKPGSGDPWTPFRVIGALVAAGVPAEAFGYYPSDHAGADALVQAHERAIVFGGPAVAAQYAGRADVQVHGPGYAKVVLGPDVVDDWERHLDLLVESVARNGGRSCINASTIVVPRHADAIAQALAERLCALQPRPLADPEATLAAVGSADLAEALDAQLDEALAVPGARDVSAEVRGTPRRAQVDRLSFLQPTVVRCEPGHALARTERGFPFVSVVQMPPEQTVDWMGPTLVAAAVTDDPALIQRFVAARNIDRLHLGAVPTTSIRWDQPHEGDLFQWLWRRRAVAWTGASAV